MCVNLFRKKVILVNSFVILNLYRYADIPVVEVSGSFNTEKLVSDVVSVIISFFDFATKYGGTPYKNVGNDEKQDAFEVKGFIIFPTMEQAIRFANEAVNKLM